MAEQTIPGGAAGTPVIILKDGSTQSRGRDAQKNNLLASKLVVDIVKSSLGPRGRDKMLVDSLGDVTITNDGLFEEALIKPQEPSSRENLTPFTVKISVIERSSILIFSFFNC